ncbi:GFA family protein [Vibrio ostreicida]|uniref:GFA family protein n=1 Tax=Vibrio ostreicida TaxID=526588 RepID=A0ABT8C077_9VIBR|nr:GFA family protein [Vibrio ostreicida]MDN3611705.1 GFA family protein [Vibrio ostreicida]NPD10100.1 GFA family protein [Vibrio ostreicida]
MTFPITVSCQCGQVTYTLKAAPLKVIACHCQQCQTLSTSAYSITATVKAQDIHFKGQLSEWRRVANSGNTNVAKFCPACGNRVYHFNPEIPTLVRLKLKPSGAVFERLFEPQMHIWMSEKQVWVTVPETIPCFDKQPTL